MKEEKLLIKVRRNGMTWISQGGYKQCKQEKKKKATATFKGNDESLQ